MNKTYIGIDNGTSGSIGIINNTESYYYMTPVFIEQSYTKTKQNISRIKGIDLYTILKPFSENAYCIIERPMVNPGRFKATVSALRALEATLIIIEQLQIPYQYIDSKEWQKELLPKNIKGDIDLKRISMDIGKRLFPLHKNLIEKHKDADGLLIAEYGKRKGY